MALYVLFAFTLLLMCIQFSLSYHLNNLILTVDPHEEECFFERMNSNSVLALNFIVTEGGFLDISFKAIYPNGTVNIEDKIKEKNFHFISTEDGIFTFCLNNEFSTLTPKTVKLVYTYIDSTERAQLKENFKEKKQNETVESLLSSLTEKLYEFAAGNDVLAARKVLHNQLNERTNSMILWWSMFEAMAMMALAIGQIYFIKKYFEVKRIV